LPSTEATALRAARPTITLDGRERPDAAAALAELHLHRPAHGMASAELVLANWGAGAGGGAGFLFDIALGARLQVGWNGRTCFDGEVTAIEERYGDGAPRLVLLAEDALHRLGRAPTSQRWEQMSLDELLRQLAQRGRLQADVATDSQPRDWLQHNESDLAFALRLLAPLALPLRLQDGRLRARAEAEDAEPLRLHAAGNATHLRLLTDLNRQPQEATSRGFDLGAGESLERRAAQLAPAPSGRTAASVLRTLGWGEGVTRAWPAPRDAAQADSYAAGLLRERAGRFQHGEVVCTDGESLHGGREVELDGVSPRLAGRWRVVDCWHRFDAVQGLRTRLAVQRAAVPEGVAT
jgi:phage protein D